MRRVYNPKKLEEEERRRAEFESVKVKRRF